MSNLGCSWDGKFQENEYKIFFDEKGGTGLVIHGIDVSTD